MDIEIIEKYRRPSDRFPPSTACRKTILGEVARQGKFSYFQGRHGHLLFSTRTSSFCTMYAVAAVERFPRAMAILYNRLNRGRYLCHSAAA